jgi:hypothetical protein
MNPQVENIMRLASLMATARCRRLAENRNGRPDDPRITKNVEDATANLRAALEAALCPP